MKLNLFSKIIFTVLVALTVNSFIYFSFGNIYSTSILNYAAFQNQFHSGIYQYRILSGYFLKWIYEFMAGFNIDYSIFKLKFFQEDAKPQMYLSFFILNTFFLIVSGVVMVLLTETKNFIATPSEKILLIVVAIFSIGISQFVLVPYDVSSYFFLLLFFYFILKYLEKKSLLNLITLIIIIVVSTFNRESSALALSLAATLFYSKFGTEKKAYLPLFMLVIAFMAVYFGMRLFSENFSTHDGNLLVENLTQPKNFLGILFWVIFFLMSIFLARDQKSIREILLFHVLGIPYILMCFYTGILYEIRLYIPLFLVALFLGKMQLPRTQ